MPLKTDTLPPRLRLAVLLSGLTCLAAGLAWLAGYLIISEADTDALTVAPAWLIYILTIGIDDSEDVVIAYTLIFLGLIVATQWLFLRPRGDWRVQLAETGRPMKTAIATAAFLAMLLSGGLILTLLDVFSPDTVTRIFDELDGNGEHSGALIGFYLTGLLVWLLWAFIFYIYWRPGVQATRLGRMVAGLLAGSVLELIVAIGVYAWDPHEEDCWCARGSYTGLVFGATVMIWAFGPGLILLFLKKQRDRQAKNSG